MISGYYFTPLTAVLFTFPSRYLFTIGRQLVFSLTPWSAWIHTKFHLYRITQEIPRRARIFDYGPVTLSGAIFHSLHLIVALPHRAPTTPPASWWFGLFRFRSPLLTESLSLSFPPVTEMFHFTGCRDVPCYVFTRTRAGIIPLRLPHSEIPGSKRVCRSPWLIAVSHVLHRLLAPRHPSCALCSLINLFRSLAGPEIFDN